MLGWIPIVGPIIDGIVSIFKKYKDVEAIKYQTDGQVSIEGFKASTQIIESTKDDIGVRLCRDIICFPIALWTALITWDTIVVLNHKEWMFHIEKFPDSVSYLPIAVVTFLLGNIGLNIWRRK